MNDLQVIEPRPATATEIKAQVQAIQSVLEAVMKKDVHYGIIPGTGRYKKVPGQPDEYVGKYTLLKAGAEKILTTFHIAVEPMVEDLSSYDVFRYRVKCAGVLPSGQVVGYGVGEASTEEEKYKWRGATCDKEFETTPEDRKRIKYGIDKKVKPWKEYEIKQVRTNPADLANTVLKMAKKRAQIDLTLTATAASDVFDQDLEDLPEEIRDGLVHEDHEPTGKPEVKQPEAKQEKPAERPAEGDVKLTVQESLDKELSAYCAKYEADPDTVMKSISEFKGYSKKVEEISTLTDGRAGAALDKLRKMAADNEAGA